MNPLSMRRDYGLVDDEDRADGLVARLMVKLAGAKGDCYEANGRNFMFQAIFPGHDKSLRLIHGEVTGQGKLDGLKYGHCWIEDGGTVLDFSNKKKIKMPKELYYALGNIGDNVIEYTPEEFRRWVLSSGHWGPWELKTESGF